MKDEQKSLRQQLKEFEDGMYNNTDTIVQIDAGWYDWFCKDKQLARKTQTLYRKVKQIAESSKINLDTMYVFFKNNCPLDGTLYDDFRICSLETGDVIFTVTPKSGFRKDKGRSEIYGRENNFNGPIVVGSWEDIVQWFIQ